ncbi:hypothetical protein CesoFtcFv8_006091 [Champsocephalus esox]|uniref:Uncharacterized protein n=1 Tax=Champsocephalus esox TaxID=159716 RepID=A0AAN8CIP3_9TELE|nr:hypothetical protein CesoFtcFv8_006091 [Champsocephalus esox]
MRLEGGSDGNPRRNLIIGGCERQSGESTADDVTTRQTREKVSRNMFLPSAYKPLPGISSPKSQRCNCCPPIH